MDSENSFTRYNNSMNETFDVEDGSSEQSVDYAALAIVVSVLAFVGIVGNVPVLIVYCRRKDYKASHTFIKVLAFLDLLVCACVMPYTVVYEYHLVTSDVTCRLFEFLRHFSIKASNITLVAIAIERYVAVCRIGTKINASCLNKGVFGIFVISLFIASPSVGLFAVVKENDVKGIPCLYPHELTRGYFCHFTYSIVGEALATTYQFVQMLLFIIVLLIIIALYTVIYVVLWRKTKIRHQLTYRKESSMHAANRRNSMIEKKALIGDNVKVTPTQDSSTERDESSTTGCAPQTAHIGPTFNDASTQIPVRNSSPLNATRCRHGSLESRCDARERGNHVTLTLGNDSRLRSRHNSLDISTRKYLSSGLGKPDLRVTFRTLPISITSTDRSDTDTSAATISKDDSKIISVAPSTAVGKPRCKVRSYHRRTAKMLFLCTVIYFVTWAPFWLDIFRLTNSRLLRYAFFIGNATNPIVYGIVNRQVRKQIKRLFASCFQVCFGAKTEEVALHGSVSGTSANV